MTSELSAPAATQRSFAEKHPVETVRPGSVRNLAFHALGLLMLAANKVRHEIRGYRRPRPFSPTMTRTALEYDIAVVTKWLDALHDYTEGSVSLHNRVVLELGPGPDLGVGLILLHQGARAYHALDVNDLARLAPWQLYEELLDDLGDAAGGTSRETLLAHVQQALAGKDARLDYVCDNRFDIRQFAGQGIDLVFSQAAFEHFDDPDRTIAQLSEVVQPGTVLISEIDLQTHSRWLRDEDPLNIYRYSDAVYRAFQFSGSPNRWRPQQYEQALIRHGWKDIVLLPGSILNDAYVSQVTPSLNARFRDGSSGIGVLNLVVCARKA